jgi:hypothetical protein
MLGKQVFVGVASSAPSEEVGRERAFRSAWAKFVRELGVEISIQTSVSQSADYMSESVVFDETSKCVNSDSFSERETFSESSGDGGVNVYVLYEIPNRRFEIERKRAASEDCRQDVGVSRASGLGVGTVIIKTTPPGARIRIDGEAFGRSPTTLVKVLTPGGHKIELDEPSHEVKEISINVLPGQTIRIDEPLKRAYGEIKIVTEPLGAKVWINGKAAGKSPTSSERVAVGEVLKIKVVDPRVYELDTETVITRSDSLPVTKLFTLQQRPANLHLFVSTPGVNVLVDGKEFSSGRKMGNRGRDLANRSHGVDLSLELSAGRHFVAVKKDGYEPFETEVDLAGGESKAISTIELIKLPDRAFSLQDPPWILSIPLGFSTATVKFPSVLVGNIGLRAERILWNRFGASIAYKVSDREIEFRDGNSTFIQHTFQFGVPTKLARWEWSNWNLHFRMTPVWNFLVNSYSIPSLSVAESNIIEFQQMAGGELAMLVTQFPTSQSDFVIGFGMRLGLVAPIDSSSTVRGVPSLSGGVEWLFGF